MKLKKILLGVGITIFVLGVIYFAAHQYVRSKITDALVEKVKTGELDYEKFSLDLWSGSVVFNKLSYQKNGMFITTDQLAVKDFNYTRFLFDKEIAFHTIRVEKPEANFKKKNDSANKKKKANKKSSPKKPIFIHQLSVNNGSLRFSNDSVQLLHVKHYNVKLNGIAVTEKTMAEKIPFTYKSLLLDVKGLQYELNKLQALQLDQLQLSENQLTVSNLAMHPKETRESYVKVIPYEKDLMELKLKKLHIPHYKFSFNDTVPVFEAPKLVLNRLDFEIYRDKTVKNDTRKKDLYSKMLRKVPAEISIDSLLIEDANIVYEELIKKDRAPGKVEFKDFQASIAPLTNKNLDRKDFPRTQVDISTSFMGKSPLKVNWNFKVNDTLDRFNINGRSFNIPASSMNAFFVPAFNMKTTGDGVEEVYFNFSGNYNEAGGELKLAYRNFKVEVLQKDGQKKNSLLSLLANVIVKKNPKNGEITKRVQNVKRDKTKSFWNYFWSCLEAGLKKAFI
ncbi:AsmA family protein [Mesonia aquimarina]|uniref:hypothetical protein n=1 Tax=Mesonia aquimarina TaxID=1504967 RepID=UPI0013CE53EF|nr:hypothetical protein [Mesonia aquimarina]